jgi:hypothetical protein
VLGQSEYGLERCPSLAPLRLADICAAATARIAEAFLGKPSLAPYTGENTPERLIDSSGGRTGQPSKITACVR